MPRKAISNPPPQMTWGKASPVLIVAGLFDAMRAACALLWFLGPALIALYCTTKASGILAAWTFGALGTNTAAAACAAGAGAIGAAGFAITAPLGTILAMAAGLLGWMTIGLWTLMTNRRLVTEDPTASLWMLGSLMLAEVPIIDAIPGLSLTMWKLYRAQIKRDKEKMAAWKEENARAAAAEQARARALAAQAAQEERSAAEAYAAEEAAAEESYEIPQNDTRAT